MPVIVDPILMSALVLGLFGSVHCLAMCGGIAGALGQATNPATSVQENLRLSLYSLGRISSYAIAGASVGLLGDTLSAWTTFSTTLRVLAGLLIIGFGFHVAGWWNGLAVIERVGMRVWRHITPLTRRVGRPDRSWKVFVLGGLWGWLPCGLVYSALLAAASTGSAVSGAAFMACFGLGTFPAMFAVTGFGARLGGRLASRSSRNAAGALLLAFGIVAILGAVLPEAHGAHSEVLPHAADSRSAHAHSHHAD